MASTSDRTIKSINQIYSLRVNQIDAKSLDNELYSWIESKLNDFEIEKLRQLSPELFALIKAYIWFNTIKTNDISIGQSLMGLKYYDLSESNALKGRLNRWQNNAILVTQIVFPYIKQRMNSFVRNESIRNGIEMSENVYKTIDFVNSLLFLYYGSYRSLWERLLRLGTGLQSNQQNPIKSELYLEIMNRELLWHTFAEFLTFVLPLINFYRIRNTFRKYLRIYVFGSDLNNRQSNVELRDANDLKNCLICHDWPINGHEIGCRHVFCYYCLMSHYLSDRVNGFTCGQCFYKIDSIESIKKVIIFSN